jgi:hypothetical protein
VVVTHKVSTSLIPMASIGHEPQLVKNSAIHKQIFLRQVLVLSYHSDLSLPSSLGRSWNVFL